MFLKMMIRRMSFGSKLVILGGLVLAVGIMLLLVKLVMWLAWFAETVALAGLVTLVVGMLLTGRKSRKHESEDGLPYL